MTAIDAVRARMAPQRANRLDYGRPRGDPGLFGPDSMAWRVHANPIALAVGGVAAVILELAEPRVRTGVWEHSIFRSDPLMRMQRTGEATLITTYGPSQAAEARIAMVGRMHARVSGTTPEGLAYTATDAELATWVHVTAGWGFLTAYDRYVEPLAAAEKDRYFAEGGRVGRMFGAVDPPASLAEVEAMLAAMRHKLVPHPILGEFLRIVATTSPFGLAGRALQPLVVQAAIDLLPPGLQAQLRLPVRSLQRAAAHATLRPLARLARRTPPEEVRAAYRRMGRALPAVAPARRALTPPAARP
jgi:uncharacterized protein (DUF2236 family)